MSREADMESTEQSIPLGLEEAVQIEDTRGPIFRLLLIMGAILLVILPFVTTFNEFLTRVVEVLGLDTFLTDWVVPFEARMIAVLLDIVGIPTQVSSTTIYLDKGGLFLPVYISWNCVGWQSFILYALTLVTGLQGPFTRASKIEASIVGLLGTFLVNLFRITSVAIVAYLFGHAPAVIYHDYGGTIIILLWLFFFWWFCHGWLLDPLDRLPETTIEERTLQEIYTDGAEGKRTPGPKGLKALGMRLGSWIRRWVPKRRTGDGAVKAAEDRGPTGSVLSGSISSSIVEKKDGKV
jgi:exosortase/archaeosortase family protein